MFKTEEMFKNREIIETEKLKKKNVGKCFIIEMIVITTEEIVENWEFVINGNWLRNKKGYWVFATNFDFLIPISLQPNVVDLGYFKLWTLLDQII